jgi:LemA protein
MGWTILIIIVAVVAFGIMIYNRLVAGRNRFKNAFAQIDVQLTRRHDLIPNLVETAKGYIKHERETLEAVINARNTAVSGLKAAAADPTDPEAMRRCRRPSRACPARSAACSRCPRPTRT